MARASRTGNRRTHLRRSIALALSIASLCLCAATIAGAARAHWHRSFEDGLAAAAQSGKPIVVFAYISQPGGAYDFAHDGMLNETLVDEGVVEALEAFEAVMFDVRAPGNQAARRRLNVSPVVTPATGVVDVERVATYPITLFLDRRGDELFRRHGYLPPDAYRLQLERSAALFEKLRAVTEEPDSAVARRELGRAYMEMDFAPDDPFYRAAVENLERATELDPNNLTGAKFDARVDLTILRLPDDPEQALTDLRDLQAQDDDGDRLFETQYYIAVAQYVLEDMAGAIRTLERFETDDRDSPWFDTPWTPQALGLLGHIRERVEAGG